MHFLTHAEVILGLQQTEYIVLETDGSVQVCIVIESGVLAVDIDPALRGFTQDGSATCKKTDQ